MVTEKTIHLGRVFACQGIHALVGVDLVTVRALDESDISLLEHSEVQQTIKAQARQDLC